VWPAVRKTSIDYLASAFPGDVLRFQLLLTHRGRTSFVMRQTARRAADDTLVATAEFVFVCIDRDGRPVPVPEEIGRSFASETDASVARLTINGVGLAVDDVGTGPAILFIHGFGLDRTMWRHQVTGLAGWRRIAPDLRGAGRSDAPDLGYSMATYAKDLAALLDALDVERVVLCGLSMGGYIAFEFLRRWPERVTGLVLMDTQAEADTAEGRKGRDALIAATRERGSVAVVEGLLPRLLAEDAPTRAPALVAELRRTIEGLPVAGLVGALQAMKDRPNSTGLLPRLNLPALVLVGEEDRITPPDVSRAMAAALPNAELEVVPGAGHVPTLEQPGLVTARLTTFLAGLPSP
jgi:3-oxoadipate enol-lactonase